MTTIDAVNTQKERTFSITGVGDLVRCYSHLKTGEYRQALLEGTMGAAKIAVWAFAAYKFYNYAAEKLEPVMFRYNVINCVENDSEGCKAVAGKLPKDTNWLTSETISTLRKECDGKETPVCAAFNGLTENAESRMKICAGKTGEFCQQWIREAANGSEPSAVIPICGPHADEACQEVIGKMEPIAGNARLCAPYDTRACQNLFKTVWDKQVDNAREAKSGGESVNALAELYGSCKDLTTGVCKKMGTLPDAVKTLLSEGSQKGNSNQWQIIKNNAKEILFSAE